MLKSIQGYKSIASALLGLVVVVGAITGLLTDEQTLAGLGLAGTLFGAAFASKIERVATLLKEIVGQNGGKP